jgi:hypothetical protein
MPLVVLDHPVDPFGYGHAADPPPFAVTIALTHTVLQYRCDGISPRAAL